MAIAMYQKENKTFYRVHVEAVNRNSGKRIQIKKAGISSLTKAREVEKTLWLQCKNENIIQTSTCSWGELIKKYFDFIEKQVRAIDKIGFSPATLKSKRSRFIHIPHWNKLPLNRIKEHFVQSELDTLETKGVSRTTTKLILKELNVILNFGVKNKILSSNPLVNVKRDLPEKELSCFTIDEANTLLREARAREHPYYLIWLLSLFTGLRRSELAGLKWSDINFEDSLITITRQKIPNEGVVYYTKTKSVRKVPLNRSLASILKEEKLKSKSEFVIDKIDSWDKGDQSEVLKAFCLKIGIKPIRHHDLRATFITQMLSDGVSLAKVKEISGHSNITTTNRYLRKSGLDLRGETDRLSIKIPELTEGNIIQLKNY